MKSSIPLRDFIWLAAILWGSSLLVYETSKQLSATFDETFYMKCGLTFWRERTNAELMRAGTMPLPVHVQSLPVYLVEQFREKPFDLTEDYGTILSYMRATNLIFWGLLLIYVFRLGFWYGGKWTARIATTLCAFEPNFSAHASLATTDIPVTAMLLVFAYHFVNSRERKWGYRVGVSGLLYGLALCTKLSALTFGPLIMLALEMPRLQQSYRNTLVPHLLKRLQLSSWRFRWDLLQIMVLGFAFSLLYCGSDFQPQKNFVKWSSQLADSSFKNVMVTSAQSLKIFPNALEAYAYQIKHNMKGHGSYIMGHWNDRAVWYYFPLALTMKMTPVVLIGLIGVALLRPRTFLHPLGLAFLFLLAFSLHSRVQIGIRFMFPLMSFAYLTLALGVVTLLERYSPVLPRGHRVLVWLSLSLCQFLPFITTFPRGISYVNAFWGGPQRGPFLLSDSNIDWGQDYFYLQQWKQEKQISSLSIWYFGSDPRVGQSPELLPLHVYEKDTLDELKARLKGKWIAVSSTLLHGNPGITRSHRQAQAYFQGRSPDARVGTFFLYNFTEESHP